MIYLGKTLVLHGGMQNVNGNGKMRLEKDPLNELWGQEFIDSSLQPSSNAHYRIPFSLTN